MMSLSDFVDAAKGVSNMFLAHEIAMDKVSRQADGICLMSVRYNLIF